ncbi:benzoate/H(+) symporter BenE family transporter, partial [Klebsiella michiganensis]|uniref:benzoate/H(+) symporter BenE family transporter n=1 Tax=Klebsiella michiganensis TaxID=1134687 RepID=UPI00224C2267
MRACASLGAILLLRGGMLSGWLLCHAWLPRFAGVAALLSGRAVAGLGGGVSTAPIAFSVGAPSWIAHDFTPALVISVG